MRDKVARMREWFYNRKLKEKIRFLFLILFTAYIVTLFFVYYFFAKKNIMQYMLESNYNTLISIENNLNVELETVSTMSELIMTNNNVIEYLKGDAKVSANATVCHNAIVSMYDISNRFNYISSVYVFKNDNEYINILKQITNVDMDLFKNPYWKKEIIEKSGSCIVRINGGGVFQRKTGEPIISVIRLINDLDTQKPIGFIVINLNTDILKNSYKDMAGKDRHFCYYSDKQDILCSSEEIKAFRQLNIQNKDFEQIVKEGFGVTETLSYYHIQNTPLVLGEFDRVSFFLYFSISEIVIIGVTIVLSIIYLSIFGIFISVYIERPIDKLIQYINIGNLKWNKKELKDKHLLKNEIENLKKRNSKLIEVNKIIDELLSKQKAMRKAELEVLQEQINPHFLYNTLSTIEDLALQISADEIYDAVETLGNFYRRFLSNGSREISLKEEIAIVQDYLKLQKLRYQDIFEDEYQLQEDVLDFKIPKLILQPLVENSLYHGIKQKGEKGIITISAYAKDGKLHIVVYDTGVGMSEEQIKSVVNEDNNKSFGLKGTVERIQYYYDVEDVFEIRSEEGVYCEVDISIPLPGGVAGCTK